jgi:uncharacterized membrane protein YqjE
VLKLRWQAWAAFTVLTGSLIVLWCVDFPYRWNKAMADSLPLWADILLFGVVSVGAVVLPMFFVLLVTFGIDESD